MAKNQYKKEPLKNNVEEMFIGPFGSSLKNECFVDEEDAYCMVYEQKHAIQKTLDGKNRFVDKNKYYELKRFTIKPGDIIVSCRGTIGETFIVPENAPLGIMHPSIMKIRLKPNVYNIEYFNLLLKNRLKDYNKSANGSGIKMAISATELGKELFPIPPMDEQQKTSKIFLMVNHLILLRKQQLAKLDELVKARFVEMFGDAKLNPNNLPCCSLSEYIVFLTSGSRGWSQYFTDSGEYFITIKNVKNCKITLQDVQCVTPPDNAEAKRTRVQENDLLISITADLGRTGIVTKEIAEHGAYINQHLTCIRLKQDKLNPLYVAYYMESDAGKEQFIAKNQSAVKAGLNFNAINSLKLMVPPLSLQNEFAAFVERVDQQKQTVQQSLEKLELMKKALMQEYFG